MAGVMRGTVMDGRTWRQLAAATAMACAAAAPGGPVLYVDDDAPPGGDGAGWGSALRFVQDALAVAADPLSGIDEIRVGQGLYLPDRDDANPDGTGDRDASFGLLPGVNLAGGYAGLGAVDPDARDVALYETILSGDLLGDDGPEFTNRQDNSRRVITALDGGDAALLDGFTVSGGCTDTYGLDTRGGGLFVGPGVRAVIVDCCFAHNSAAYGGGAANGGTTGLTFTGCTFVENAAWSGGGLYNNQDSYSAVIDCTFQSNTASAGGGAYNNGSDASYDGCTFIGNASTSSSYYGYGAAVHVGGGRPTLTGCTFTANASSGSSAALHSDAGGSPVVVGCTFEGNLGRAVSGDNAILIGCTFAGNAVLGDGGGVSVGEAMVIGCTFSGNTATGRGGAVFLDDDTAFIDCLFTGNAAALYGGAICGISRSNVSLVSCTLIDNTADFGGALYLNETAPHLTNCALIGNAATEWGGAAYTAFADPVFTNCLLNGNSAGGTGGGLHNFRSSPRLTNCTLTNNSAGTDGGGIYNQLEAYPVIVNCILWQNTDGGPADESAQVYHFTDSQSAVSYSCVQGWTGALGGVGNFPDDPQLLDPAGPDGIPGTADDDLRLPSGSPCVDAGDSAVVPSCATDLDSTDRIVDDPGTPDSGPGTPPHVDLGAYEFGGMPLEDCNHNALGDDCELAGGITPDCNTNGVPDDCDIVGGTSSDCNGNGVPDECDLADGTSTDCDGNGRPDACDLADGTLPDCNENGIPDGCDILNATSADCNANGVPDECDLARETSPDCNGNGVPDECDLAEETSPDCNDNGIPDECDVVTIFTETSPALSPIGTGSPQAYVLRSPPEARGETVTLTFSAMADLVASYEYIDVEINGVAIGTVFTSGAHDCPPEPDVDELTLTGESYNAILQDSGPDLAINMIASITVDPALCDGTSTITVTAEYLAVDRDRDANENGIPDECETPGDIDGDGIVGVTDFLALLAAWGPCPGPPDPCYADLDGDGSVGVGDFLILLANWS
jgi:predicted outer membrane repeat protein